MEENEEFSDPKNVSSWESLQKNTQLFIYHDHYSSSLIKLLSRYRHIQVQEKVKRTVYLEPKDPSSSPSAGT